VLSRGVVAFRLTSPPALPDALVFGATLPVLGTHLVVAFALATAIVSGLVGDEDLVVGGIVPVPLAPLVLFRSLNR
jgi:uncharacterized protein (DUF2062 family)